MKEDKTSFKQIKLLRLLKAWQILELGLLLISLPISFAYAVMLIGDSNQFLKLYTRYIFPILGILLIIPSIMAIIFFLFIAKGYKLISR